MDNCRTTYDILKDVHCTSHTSFLDDLGGASDVFESADSGSTDAVVWSKFVSLILSDKAKRSRLQGLGGSDANIILSRDVDRIRQLWLEKRGEVDPADLSSNIAVMLGCWTKPFNRQWYEQLTGERLGDVGRSFTCKRHEWRRCTVDGLIEGPGAIWEANRVHCVSTGSRVSRHSHRRTCSRCPHPCIMRM